MKVCTPRNTLHCTASRTTSLCFILGLPSTDDQRASVGCLSAVSIVLLWLHDDEQANGATTGGGGAPHGAVEFGRVDVTGVRITHALRVADVVRMLDVPNGINVDSGPGAERSQR